jgi:hypothetical protein
MNTGPTVEPSRYTPLRVHICTPADDQLAYYAALRTWLADLGYAILGDHSESLDEKLKAAAACDVCLLLLGPIFGRGDRLSFFSHAELEAATASDIHPGKLLVFRQSTITECASEEQREFIERHSHFVTGTLSSLCYTPSDFVLQVREALAAWSPPLPAAPPHPLDVASNAVMISSTSDLLDERFAVRDAADRPGLDCVL